MKKFLDKVVNLYDKIDENTEDDTKSLGRAPGGPEPGKKAQEGDFEESYEKTIF